MSSANPIFYLIFESKLYILRFIITPSSHLYNIFITFHCRQSSKNETRTAPAGHHQQMIPCYIQTGSSILYFFAIHCHRHSQMRQAPTFSSHPRWASASRDYPYGILQTARPDISSSMTKNMLLTISLKK